MDNLEISRIEYDIRHKLGWTEVYITLEAHDKALPHILDFREFIKDVQTSGLYPLFTCSCGSFGCGGYYVEVECTDNSWILRNRYDPLDETKILENIEYRIPWLQAEAPDSPIH